MLNGTKMTQEISTTAKPGAMALQAMKTVTSVEVFKTPANPPSRCKAPKKKVLDEDVYIKEMGKIIQRDFFPDLEKLKAQNEYLEAVEKNDVQKMRELYAKYSSGKRPPTERYASPANFETPEILRRQDDPASAADLESLRGDESDSGSVAGESVKLSLDQYLNTATSEDNQSFVEIMEEADLKHRQKFGWLYECEKKSETEVRDMLALPSIEEQANSTQRPLMVDTWGYRNKNFIMYVPDGVPLTPAEQIAAAARAKEISHANTRLARNPFDEARSRLAVAQAAQAQSRGANDGRIGVDGKVVSAEDSPRVSGFSFVAATPSPAPGVCESPLMTWGEIAGTPFRLDGGDTPLRPDTRGPSFRIAEPPKRETLALSLAEKAGEWHRDKKKKAIIAARKQLATPSPRSSERLGSMSPAARRLASTQLRKRIGSDRALQASYSPRPPRSVGPRSRDDDITDDLLHIPRRPRAADFFDA